MKLNWLQRFVATSYFPLPLLVYDFETNHW